MTVQRGSPRSAATPHIHHLTHPYDVDHVAVVCGGEVLPRVRRTRILCAHQEGAQHVRDDLHAATDGVQRQRTHGVRKHLPAARWHGVITGMVA